MCEHNIRRGWTVFSHPGQLQAVPYNASQSSRFPKHSGTWAYSATDVDTRFMSIRSSSSSSFCWIEAICQPSSHFILSTKFLLIPVLHIQVADEDIEPHYSSLMSIRTHCCSIREGKGENRWKPFLLCRIIQFSQWILHVVQLVGCGVATPAVQ